MNASELYGEPKTARVIADTMRVMSTVGKRPYRVIPAPLDRVEFAITDGMGKVNSDNVTCVCGNTAADDGFGVINPVSGKWCSIMSDEPESSLLDTFPAMDSCFAVCHACGRCYDDDDLSGATSVVQWQYDVTDPEFQAGQLAYWEDLNGEE